MIFSDAAQERAIADFSGLPEMASFTMGRRIHHGISHTHRCTLEILCESDYRSPNHVVVRGEPREKPAWRGVPMETIWDVLGHARTQEQSWSGPLVTIVNGHEFTRPIWLGCAGDWPRVKDELEDAEAWSTVRLGPYVVAVGPGAGPGMALVAHALVRPAGGVAPDGAGGDGGDGG